MHPKITNYQVVEAKDSFHLNEAVVRLMSDRWQPLGGVSIAIIDNSSMGTISSMSPIETTYAQAMVQYEISGNL